MGGVLSNPYSQNIMEPFLLHLYLNTKGFSVVSLVTPKPQISDHIMCSDYPQQGAVYYFHEFQLKEMYSL